MREYCGALPPPGVRRTGTCVLAAGHTIPHRNLDGDRWTTEEESS